MRSPRRKVVLFAAVAAAGAAVLYGKGVCEEVYLSLERYAVTPTGYAESQKLLPESASVVTKDDIRMSNVKQTTEILNELPGVFVRKTGDFGRADVDIRGIGGNGRQIGVFIDGRPEKMGVFGCAVTHTFPLNNVERIEVVRGPESVVYGSDAFGGVVNIITHRAQQRMEGNFLASGGTYNTQNYLFQQGSKLGALDYFISVNKRSTDGHIENAAFNATDFSGNVGYALSPTSDLCLSAKYFTGIKNEPFPSAAGTWNDYGRGAVDLTYRNVIGDFDNSLKVYRTFGEHKFSDNSHYKDYTNGVMARTKTSPFAGNVLSMGADYRYQFGDVITASPASMIGEHHKYEYGVYFEDAQTFAGKYTVTGGARYNYDEFAGNIAVPKLGLVYNAQPGTILRALWSQGFRAPQINDLFLWGGNEDLKPEKVNDYEVGLRQRVGVSTDIDLSYFIMKGSDLIEMRSGKNVNIGDFDFRGVEMMVTGKLTDALSGQANYTWLDTGTKTTGRPGDKAGAALKYTQGKVNAILSGEYVGRYYAADNSTAKIDDFLIFNAKVDYRLFSNISVFGAVDNITDQKYQIYYSGLYTMPGTTLTLGVNYIFG